MKTPFIAQLTGACLALCAFVLSSSPALATTMTGTASTVWTSTPGYGDKSFFHVQFESLSNGTLTKGTTPTVYFDLYDAGNPSGGYLELWPDGRTNGFTADNKVESTVSLTSNGESWTATSRDNGGWTGGSLALGDSNQFSFSFRTQNTDGSFTRYYTYDYWKVEGANFATDTADYHYLLSNADTGLTMRVKYWAAPVAAEIPPAVPLPGAALLLGSGLLGLAGLRRSRR